MDTKPCPQCGGDIVRQPQWTAYYWEHKQFCSRRCAGLAQRPMRLRCRRCGSEIAGRGRHRVYCSKACYHEDVRDRPFNAQKRGRAMAAKRYQVRPCESCGASNRPELKGPASKVQRHHRDGDQMNNAPDNIAFLCFPCHRAEHARMRASGIGRMPGGPRPRVTALMRERAQQRYRHAVMLRSHGLSSREIAADLGVDRASVDRWFRKYGGGSAGTGLPPTDTP